MAQALAPGASPDEPGEPGEKQQGAPSHPRPVQLVGWHDDAAGYRAAWLAHRTSKRPVVLYFCDNHEPHCAMLDRMFTDARVRRALASTERVRIVPGRSAAEHAVARKYGVRGYPTLLLFPGRSNQPVRLHPFTSRVDGQGRLEAAEDFAADLTRALR